MASEEDLQVLRQRIAELESVAEANQALRQRQLDLAAKVHGSLLPRPIRHERISVDVRYIPIEEVGGDYCQVWFPYRDVCYISIWDVTGHGVGAGLLATRVSSEVRYSILYGRGPGEIVRSLNQFLCENFDETGLYLTSTVARIDLAERRITWCGAGHPSPLLIHRRTSKIDLLASQNPIVGVTIPGVDHDVEEILSLEPGDRLIFYTDGLTETTDRHERQLGVNGLAEIATHAMPLGLFDMADRILDQIAEYQHGPTTDDKTLIVAELL